MTATHTAYLALGSNVGDRLSHFREALQFLRSHEAITVSRVSGVYETEPVGVRDQPWFLNAVVDISTTLPPLDLLSEVKRIEGAIGRTPTYRWGPREIDLDILLYEGVTCSDEVLTIPHPRMAERLFVLLPLRDLCPEWVDPRGKSIERLIEELEGTAVVRSCPQAV